MLEVLKIMDDMVLLGERRDGEWQSVYWYYPRGARRNRGRKFLKRHWQLSWNGERFAKSRDAEEVHDVIGERGFAVLTSTCRAWYDGTSPHPPNKGNGQELQIVKE